MATTDLYPLFSTPVVSVDLGGPKLQYVVDGCENDLQYTLNAGNNFTSNNKNVFDLPEFSKIKEHCLEAVNNYAKEILKENPIKERLKSKGALGEYILGIMEHRSSNEIA